jgi:hypothetical protein
MSREAKDCSVSWFPRLISNFFGAARQNSVLEDAPSGSPAFWKKCPFRFHDLCVYGVYIYIYLIIYIYLFMYYLSYAGIILLLFLYMHDTPASLYD